MVDVITEILRPIVKDIANHVTSNLRSLFSSTKYVTDMGAKYEDLIRKRDKVHDHIANHNVMELEIPQDVRDWLNAVKAMDETVQDIPSNNIGCSNIRRRYINGKKAFNAANTIKILIDRNPGTSWERMQITHGHVGTSTSAPTASSPGGGVETKSDYNSRQKPFKDALKFLQQDDTTQVIALCGMGGVGKTTMMKRLKKEAEDKKMFDQIVMAIIKRDCNMYSVQDDIADHTGGRLKERGETTRAEYLRKRFENMLKDEKRILVILDDVWGVVELENIGLASPLPNGVKLLLTSRDENVCRMIAANVVSIVNIVKVNVLGVEEAHNFFSSITKVSEVDDRYEIGCGIVKKCGYLPLAIKLMAGTLKDKEKRVWRTTLDFLKKKDFTNDVKEIIKVSYEALGKEEKQILLLCGLHPEDSNILIEDLTRYAWGLRLFKTSASLGFVRDKTERCVSNLKSANVLMDGDDDNTRCIKMHDLVLAFVVDVSKYEDACIIDHGNESKWSEVRLNESCKRISLSCQGRSEFTSDFKFRSLSILKLINGDDSLRFPLDFYEEMKNLEVIGYEEMIYPLLPTSFQFSPNLRTLCLNRCSLPFDYSCIGDLLNLEVLSFANSNIRQLPSTFRNLTKLRLLDLTDCRDLVIDDGVLGSLGSLEELYMSFSDERMSFYFTNRNYSEVAKLSKNLHALEINFINKDAQPKDMLFEKLKRFKISVGCPSLDDVKDILWKNEKASYKNTLMLVTSKDRLLESRMNEMFKETKHLYLEIESMKDLEDVNVHAPPQNSSFHNLRSLVVLGCVNLKYLFTLNVATNMPYLENLGIAKCPVMEAIIHTKYNEAQTITFPKLKHLGLDDLPKLSCLCDNDNKIKLPYLVKLFLTRLPNITSIYQKNELATSSNNYFLNEQVDIHGLEELYISDMNNLEEIWPCEYIINEDSKLRTMKVIGCERLENLFPSNPMSLLCHLEELKVNNCASIETLFNVDMDWISKTEEGRSSMLRRIKVKGCERIVNLFTSNPMSLLCHLEELEVDDCASIETLFNVDMDWISKFEEVRSSMLRTIKVRGCKRIVNLFPSNPMSLLCHLEELEVHNCDSIETLFDVDMKKVENGRSSMLRWIDIHNLKNLREIWRVKGLNDCNIVIGGFEALECIRIGGCGAFKDVFSPPNACFNMGTLMDIDMYSISIYSSGECKRNNEHEIDVAFPSSLMRNFHHLHNLHLSNCERVKVVFKIESGSQKELAQTQPQALLPYLEVISLENIERMTHVWKCNWNEFFILQKQHQPSFRNLTTVDLSLCNNIKYLFSPLMVTLLSNLKKIKISGCDCMEEVVSNMDDNDEEMHGKSQTITTLFPHLDYVSLYHLKNLMRIGGDSKGQISSNNTTIATSISDQSKVSRVGVVPWSLCQYSREVTLQKCDKMTIAIPSYALEHMQMLEVLRIECCDSMIEVFETQWINNISGGSSNTVVQGEGSSGAHPPLESPRLKNIHVPQLHHLKEVKIYDCKLLQHVFPFSALKSLKHLEKLGISTCEKMKVIVKEENLGEQKEVVVFSRLMSIELEYLPNLEGFFLGMNDFQWESLELVKIRNCPRIRLFTAGRSTSPKLNFIHIDRDKYSLEHALHFHETTTNLDQTQFPSLDSTSFFPASSQRIPFDFHNIVELKVDGADVKHVIPCKELPQLEKLEKIVVSYCDEVEEIFKVASEGNNSGYNESRTAVEIPNLREVELTSLSNLLYIWKNNQHAILQFPNLTILYIKICHGLKHVFTCSMTASLLQLQVLHLYYCFGLETIVKEDEGCDGEKDKMISLPCLKSLQLEELSSLQGFCLGKHAFSFPMLDTLIIKLCPALMVFTKGHLTTPKLNSIGSRFGLVYLKEKEDLNSFIKTKQQEGLWN